MNTSQLPPETEMYRALCTRDSEYEGVFFAAIKTTGIFCRPTCSARNPKAENVQYFARAADALASGFRPCKRCRPLEVFGQAPDWLTDFLDTIESDPTQRWNDLRLKEHGIEPSRIRRWFNKHHNMTFQPTFALVGCLMPWANYNTNHPPHQTGQQNKCQINH